MCQEENPHITIKYDEANVASAFQPYFQLLLKSVYNMYMILYARKYSLWVSPYNSLKFKSTLMRKEFHWWFGTTIKLTLHRKCCFNPRWPNFMCIRQINLSIFMKSFHQLIPGYLWQQGQSQWGAQTSTTTSSFEPMNICSILGHYYDFRMFLYFKCV